MRKEDCFYLGTVVAKYSFKGEVLIKLDTDDPETYLSVQSFLLEDESGLIPYFTTKVQFHKSQLLRVSVEGVKSEKQADMIIGKSITLPSGATHDASAMADLCPISMLFVRCRNGISHAPEEFASRDDMHLAVETIAKFLTSLDTKSLVKKHGSLNKSEHE